MTDRFELPSRSFVGLIHTQINALNHNAVYNTRLAVEKKVFQTLLKR